MEKDSANECSLNNLTELLCLIPPNLWYCDGALYGGHNELYTATLLFNVSKYYSEKMSEKGMQAELEKVLHV